MIEKFIASFKQPPTRLVLDFDATDDPVHGLQEGRFFHGYYDHYCFLPLYVFCGSQLLVAYLRPSNIDPARHAWAILSLLVKRLRKQWPKVEIIFRGDNGFCRWRMLRWCDNHRVGYIGGLGPPRRLLRTGLLVAGFRGLPVFGQVTVAGSVVEGASVVSRGGSVYEQDLSRQCGDMEDL